MTYFQANQDIIWFTLLLTISFGVIHWYSIQYEKTKKNFEKYSKCYEILFQNNSKGILEIDSKGRFIVVNTAASAIFGYTSKELAQVSLDKLIVTEDLERVFLHLQRAFCGEAQYFHGVVINKWQKAIDMEFIFIPILVEHKVSSILSIINKV